MQKILPKNIEDSDVYTRLSYKMHNEINDLSFEERKKLEDLLFDIHITNYADKVRRATDEELLQMSADEGALL